MNNKYNIEHRYILFLEVDGQKRKYFIPESSPAGKLISLQLERKYQKGKKEARRQNKVPISHLLTASNTEYNYETIYGDLDK